MGGARQWQVPGAGGAMGFGFGGQQVDRWRKEGNLYVYAIYELNGPWEMQLSMNIELISLELISI